MDVFGPFIRECCVVHKNAEVWASDLLKAYKAWCIDDGTKEQSQHKLGRYLTNKGYIVDGSSGRVKRLGIGLLVRSDLSDLSDLSSGNSYIESAYNDFSGKGQNPQNPQK
jgi:hypothetical protein